MYPLRPNLEENSAKSTSPSPSSSHLAMVDCTCSLGRFHRRHIAASSFHPTRPCQLWIVNAGSNSVSIVFNPGTRGQSAEWRQDTCACHFMSRPTALAFGGANSGTMMVSATALSRAAFSKRNIGRRCCSQAIYEVSAAICGLAYVGLMQSIRDAWGWTGTRDRLRACSLARLCLQHLGTVHRGLGAAACDRLSGHLIKGNILST